MAGTSLVGHGKVRESILHDQDNSLSSLELKTCFTVLFSSTKYFTSCLIDVVSFPAKFVFRLEKEFTLAQESVPL